MIEGLLNNPTVKKALALGEDVTTLRAPALALAWLGDGPVIGQRGALMLGGRELLLGFCSSRSNSLVMIESANSL